MTVGAIFGVIVQAILSLGGIAGHAVGALGVLAGIVQYLVWFRYSSAGLRWILGSLIGAPVGVVLAFVLLPLWQALGPVLGQAGAIGFEMLVVGSVQALAVRTRLTGIGWWPFLAGSAGFAMAMSSACPMGEWPPLYQGRFGAGPRPASRECVDTWE